MSTFERLELCYLCEPEPGIVQLNLQIAGELRVYTVNSGQLRNLALDAVKLLVVADVGKRELDNTDTFNHAIRIDIA